MLGQNGACGSFLFKNKGRGADLGYPTRNFGATASNRGRGRSPEARPQTFLLGNIPTGGRWRSQKHSRLGKYQKDPHIATVPTADDTNDT